MTPWTCCQTTMSEDRFRGLTKGNDQALEALGVARLEADEETATYRITAPAWVHDILRAQKGKSKARAIGTLLTGKLK